MKHFFRYLFVVAVLLSGFGPAGAQISIRRDVNPGPLYREAVPFDLLANPRLENLHYRTDGARRADRLLRRKERNAYELSIGLTSTQTYFSNWAKGGDNTFSGLLSLDFKHVHKKEKLTLTTKFSSKYGMSIIDSVVYKNKDEFEINEQIAWSINPYWSYSGTLKFNSQFTKGYKSKDNKTLVSNFMAPATINLSLGFTYKNSPWNISLSPASGNIVLVLSDTLSKQGINGVPAGKRQKIEMGASADINFDKKFGPNDCFRYVFNAFSFSNYTKVPTFKWENTLSIQATKWLSTKIYWYLLYDKEVETPKGFNKLQYNYLFGLELGYTFKK